MYDNQMMSLTSCLYYLLLVRSGAEKVLSILGESPCMIQIAKFVLVLGVDNTTAIECLPLLINTLMIFTKYLNGVFNRKRIRAVFDRIKSNSERLMDLPEYEILHKHALRGRLFVLYMTALSITLIGIFVCLPTTLIINNLVHNKTKIKLFEWTYVFVDDNDAYVFMTIHSYFGSLLLAYLIDTLDSVYITLTQHVCAMFAVVGYRLKTIHILNAAILKKEVDPRKYNALLADNQEQMYEKLVMCIKEHQRALECADIVQSAFSTALFFQVSLIILMLSITGVHALLFLARGNLTNMTMQLVWLIAQYNQLFLLYLPGQRLLDFSTQIYFDALDCHWVKCFKKSRVIYQIMVMRSLRHFKLTALKVTSLNMESFLSVTQAAVSYFTVFSATI